MGKGPSAPLPRNSSLPPPLSKALKTAKQIHFFINRCPLGATVHQAALRPTPTPSKSAQARMKAGITLSGAAFVLLFSTPPPPRPASVGAPPARGRTPGPGTGRNCPQEKCSAAEGLRHSRTWKAPPPAHLPTPG